MVILVSIIVTATTLAVASGVGWILKYIRQRDEKDNDRLKFFEQINNDIENIINEKERNEKSNGGNTGA